MKSKQPNTKPSRAEPSRMRGSSARALTTKSRARYSARGRSFSSQSGRSGSPGTGSTLRRLCRPRRSTAVRALWLRASGRFPRPPA
jgi:hypothetical protein